MKKIKIAFICILLLTAVCAQASELTGRISTDPRQYKEGSSDIVITPAGSGPKQEESADKNFQAAPVLTINARTAENDDNRVEDGLSVKVLGAVYYPDGSLLRGQNKKIFIIINGRKKQIKTLQELKRYQGRIIINIGNDELAGFSEVNYTDGQLIRQIGAPEVYVIREGKRKHIAGIKDLIAGYFGLEIFNIGADEMAEYL